MDLCLFADVYGFSAMVRENLSDTSARLKVLSDTCESLVMHYTPCNNEKISLHLFSDNIMLVSQLGSNLDPSDKIESMQAFVNLCTQLYTASVSQEMPLRGCVAVGDVETRGSQLLGKPIIEAAEFEKNIRLPFLFVPARMIDSLTGFEKNVSPSFGNVFHMQPKDIPYGQGIISTYLILPTDKSSIKSLATKLYIKYRKHEYLSKPALDWKNVIEIIDEIESTCYD